MLWFTSDHHFGDEKVRLYRMRPFENVDEMNAALLKSWNDHIAPDDKVFHLGDFAATDEALEEFAPQLNGHIRLILGNHDLSRPRELLQEYFEILDGPVKYKFNQDRLFLCHYPKQRPNPETSDIYTICGHIHDLFKVARRMVNVGVDAWHFKPVSLEQILNCRESEQLGRWDANVYPDAPLDWQWKVSNIQERSGQEPTIPILMREMQERKA